jgi:hypothetical protein
VSQKEAKEMILLHDIKLNNVLDLEEFLTIFKAHADDKTF